MRLLSDGFIERWHDRIINIHPSLLPAFRGLNAHAQALAAGVKIAGCTVHVVRPDVDSGPIIAQAAVLVHEDDDEESLRARILTEEHRLLPAVVRAIAERRVVIEDRKVRILGVGGPSGENLRSL